VNGLWIPIQWKGNDNDYQTKNSSILVYDYIAVIHNY